MYDNVLSSYNQLTRRLKKLEGEKFPNVYFLSISSALSIFSAG